MLRELFKTIFKPSPADRAFKKCMAASRELGTTAMTFHEAFKMVGIDLQPDESALDELGRILSSSTDPERTLEGVSVFLGCVIIEQLGGSWQREGSGYRIVGVGSQNGIVDLTSDIRAPLASQQRQTPRIVYETIRTRVTGSA